LIRYIVLKEKRNEVKFYIKKIEISSKEFKTKQERIKVHLNNGNEIYLKKDWFYKTYKEAQRVMDERLIAHNFKESKKNEYGMWVCPNGGSMKDTVFRVGHIGCLTTQDYDKLISSFVDMRNKMYI
jgi:aspartate aminotransferase-like enzyme